MNDPATLAVAGTAAYVILLLAALRWRWLARVPHGFFWTLLLALGGVAAGAALLIATQGYNAARRIVFEQRHAQLRMAADLLNGRLQDGIREMEAQLKNVATDLPAVADRALDEKERQELEDLDRFSEAILQVHLVDGQGRIVIHTGTSEAMPPPPPETLPHVMQGRTFVSDPLFLAGSRQWVIELCIPARNGHGRVTGSLCVIFDLQRFLADNLHGVPIGETGFVMVADAAGHILEHPDASQIGHDASKWASVQAALRGEHGWRLVTPRGKPRRLVMYEPVKSPSTSGRPWVLLAEMNSSEVAAPVRALAARFVPLTVGVVVGGLVLALPLSSSLRRPLGMLVDLAKRIQGGDLQARSTVQGRDELGELSEALNRMVGGLEERERIKDLFGRYVTTQISEQVLRGQVHLGGERRRITVLFSDIRDFTRMSEGMPAEDVVAFLNEYFSEMVEAVFEYGGVLDKFIGDGMLVLFGAFGEGSHPRQAVLAGLRMREHLAGINTRRKERGLEPIHIGIGIHTDDVIVGNIGSRRRLDYTVIGDGVNTTSRLESLNKQFGTTILITQQTFDDLPSGEFECRQMPETDLRGKSRRMTFYEVVGTAALRSTRTPPTTTAPSPTSTPP